MFDIGFFEIILISVVALLVLGPERLPDAIRTVSLWIGRLRRSFDHIKKDIEREIGADEIRRQLRNEEILEKFNESKKQLTAGFGAVKQETEAIRKEAEAVTKELNDETIKTADQKLTKKALTGKTGDQPGGKTAAAAPSSPPPAETGKTAVPNQDAEARAPTPASTPEAPESRGKEQ